MTFQAKPRLRRQPYLKSVTFVCWSGSQEAAARQRISASNLKIVACDNLDDAAKKVTSLCIFWPKAKDDHSVKSKSSERKIQVVESDISKLQNCKQNWFWSVSQIYWYLIKYFWHYNDSYIDHTISSIIATIK